MDTSPVKVDSLPENASSVSVPPPILAPVPNMNPIQVQNQIQIQNQGLPVNQGSPANRVSVIQALPAQNQPVAIPPPIAPAPINAPAPAIAAPVIEAQPIDDIEMGPLPGFPADVSSMHHPQNLPPLRWPAGSGTSRSRREDFNASIDLRTVPVVRRSKHGRIDNDRYRYREMHEMKRSCGYVFHLLINL